MWGNIVDVIMLLLASVNIVLIVSCHLSACFAGSQKSKYCWEGNASGRDTCVLLTNTAT